MLRGEHSSYVWKGGLGPGGWQPTALEREGNGKRKGAEEAIYGKEKRILPPLIAHIAEEEREKEVGLGLDGTERGRGDRTAAESLWAWP